MTTARSTDRLIAPLLGAVADDANWTAFLAELSDQCRSEVAILFLHDYRSHAVPYFASYGVDERLGTEYVARLGAVNPWVAEQQPMAEGTVVLSHELASDASIPRSQYYDEFLRPLGIRHAVGTNILKSDGRAVKLGVLRSPKHGPMGNRERALLYELMPSLQSALRLRSRLEMLESRNRMNWAAIEALAIGVIFLDGSGIVSCMNAAASDICSAADGIFVDEQGRLSACAHNDRRWLRTTIDRVRRSSVCDGAAGTQVGSVCRRSGLQPLSLRIEPIGGTSVGDAAAAEIVVFVCEPDRSPQELEEALTAIWCLTAAESRVAGCLLRGLSLREAAAHLGIAEGTARFFSKQIFAKTSTRGQTEFVRVATKSVASLTCGRVDVEREVLGGPDLRAVGDGSVA